MDRVIDLTFSVSALIILSPLLLIIIIALRLTGEGEIFYQQTRVGKNGKDFKIYKFVTMLKDSPNMGSGTVTLKDDPRILPLGKVLRRSKLNEIPQLINIIAGEMSLIGPRPQTRRCFLAFNAHVQADIIKVRPGLSGIGSIIFRSEDAMLSDLEKGVDFYDEVIAPYKGELERWFVYNKSLKLYFILLFSTLYCVIFPKQNFIWDILENLPRPPEELARFF